MDSNVKVRAFDTSRSRTSRIACRPEAERVTRNRASRVDSILQSDENVHAFEESTTRLLACLEEWNSILTEELKNRRGGLTKPLNERQFPKELLSVVVEYTVPTDLQLVLSSKCKHLKGRCHFGSTRRVGISPASDVRDILYAFLYVDEREFALTATDAEGTMHDFSVLSRLLPGIFTCLLT